MFDSTAALLTYQAQIHFTTGATPTRIGNRHPSIAPYDTFDASDGEFLLAVGNDEQWRRFCRVIGTEDLGADVRFSTNQSRVAHCAELQPLLVGRLRTQPRSHWIAELRAVGVPCGAVRNVAEVLADPQLEARQMIATIDHATAGPIQVLGVPIKLSDTPGAVRTPPPALGQHTDDILRDDCGLSSAEIAGLRQTGAVE
jgi:crotonobetainyl-CoA:carnitine CoA-transferase CaiB-like acyl-CoA transferase